MSKVYARVDGNGYITGIDGGYTMGNLRDLTGWVLLDEGEGDRYNLCQSNYLPGPLTTDSGACRYRVVEGKPVECTAEELSGQEAAMLPAGPTLEARVVNLESTTDDMILLMAELIGGE